MCAIPVDYTQVIASGDRHIKSPISYGLSDNVLVQGLSMALLLKYMREDRRASSALGDVDVSRHRTCTWTRFSQVLFVPGGTKSPCNVLSFGTPRYLLPDVARWDQDEVYKRPNEEALEVTASGRRSSSYSSTATICCRYLRRC